MDQGPGQAQTLDGPHGSIRGDSVSKTRAPVDKADVGQGRQDAFPNFSLGPVKRPF